MAINVVSSAAATGTSQSVTVASSALGAITNGNLLVAIVNVGWYSGTVAAWTPPTGWTSVYTRTQSNGTCCQVCTKIAASESGNYTFAWSGGGPGQYGTVHLFQIAQQAASSPFDQALSVNGGSAGSFTTPSITAAQSGELILALFNDYSGGSSWTGGTFSTPSGMTAAQADSLSGLGASQGWASFYEVASGTFSGTLASSAGTSDSNGQATVVAIKGVVAPATLVEEHYELFNDDGTINAASSCSAQDTAAYNVETGQNYRIRIQTANTGSAGASIARRLEFSEDSGAWTQITTGSNNVRLSTSTQFTDGAATTQRLTATGTFQAGQGKQSSSDTSSITLAASGDTEDEWCMQWQATAAGHTYQFRVSNTGTALTTYSVSPIFAPLQWEFIGVPVTLQSTSYNRKTRAVLQTSNATYPAYARLYDITDGVVVTNSKTPAVTATSPTEVFSATSFPVTAGKQYQMQVGIAPAGTVTIPSGASGGGSGNMNFRNVWTNGGTYAVNDVVLSMGNLFVCVTAIAGSTTVPISDSHFMMCTNSLNQYGGWYAGINYYQNNLVTYSGVPYLCTSFVNSTTAPPSDTAHWIALGSSSSLYKSGFTNSALASGLLTVTHNLGVQYPLVEIYDNNGNLATPNKISSPNINTAIVDLTNYLTIPTASNCAWWAMDEASGTTVANGDGGSAGTASGTANIVAGMYGNARQFDGSTGFVNGSDAGFPFSTAMRSIMCWFKISALTLTTGNYWVLWGYGSNTSAGMWALVIYYTTGTGYRLGVTNGTSFWLFPWGTGDTNWHHLAVTLPNGATVIGQSLVYLDGIIQSSATGASPLAAVATNLSEFAFAVKPVAHTNFFPGIIDDVRMYPLFLSQPQVAACMMQGALQGTWDASVRS